LFNFVVRKNFIKLTRRKGALLIYFQRQLEKASGALGYKSPFGGLIGSAKNSPHVMATK